jgi:hypothetical protein
MAKYFIITKHNDFYNFYFSYIPTNDIIENAYNIVYNYTIDDLAKGIAEALFEDRPEDFEDFEDAKDVAYDMVKNQWSNDAIFGENGDYVDCIDEDKEHGILILSNKSKLWDQLQKVIQMEELLTDLGHIGTHHIVDIILDNVRN